MNLPDLNEVKRKRDELGYNNTTLAKAANASYEQIRSWLEGRAKSPSYTVVTNVLEVLKINNDIPHYPFVGSLAAGCAKTIAEINESDDLRYVPAPVSIRNGIVGMVESDSMDKKIPVGLYVLVNLDITDPQLCDKKVVLASVNGDCSLKEYHHTSGCLMPHSNNGIHKPYYITKTDEFRIVGVCEWFYGKL